MWLNLLRSETGLRTFDRITYDIDLIWHDKVFEDGLGNASNPGSSDLSQVAFGKREKRWVRKKKKEEIIIQHDIVHERSMISKN